MNHRSGILLCYICPKIGEQHIETKYSKCKMFQVISDLLNSDNLKVDSYAMSYRSEILLCYS